MAVTIRTTPAGLEYAEDGAAPEVRFHVANGGLNCWIENVPAHIKTAAELWWTLREVYADIPGVQHFIEVSGGGKFGGWWTSGGRNFVARDDG